jgi:hypothetical protein
MLLSYISVPGNDGGYERIELAPLSGPEIIQIVASASPHVRKPDAGKGNMRDQDAEEPGNSGQDEDGVRVTEVRPARRWCAMQ